MILLSLRVKCLSLRTVLVRPLVLTIQSVRSIPLSFSAYSMMSFIVAVNGNSYCILSLLGSLSPNCTRVPSLALSVSLKVCLGDWSGVVLALIILSLLMVRRNGRGMSIGVPHCEV